MELPTGFRRLLDGAGWSTPFGRQWPRHADIPTMPPGSHRREAVMRFFDDRDDTPEQVIGDLIGLLVSLAMMAWLLDAVIPH